MTKSVQFFSMLLAAAGTFSAVANAETQIIHNLSALPATINADQIIKIASNNSLEISEVADFTVNGALYNSGTGTTSINNSIAGTGKLVVESGAFKFGAAATTIAEELEIQISENGKFIFSAPNATFRGNISKIETESGTGIVEIANKTNFEGANITGTVNIVAGGAFVVAGTNKTTEITGTVNIAGGNVYRDGAWQNGGQLTWYSDRNSSDYGVTLKINGDLNCLPLEYAEDSEGNVGIAHYGSIVELKALNMLEVTGTAKLAGTLLLTTYSNLPQGQVYKVFKAGKIEGNWDYVVASDNTLLVTAGVAGIGENEFGVARVESKKLHSREFTRHNGFDSFINYLANESNRYDGKLNEVAQAVALASSGDDLANTINAFSPSVYSAFPAIAVAQSVSEVDYLRRVLEVGLSAPKSEDGIRVVNNLQWFSNFQYESSANRDSRSSPTFDYQSLGILAGVYSWIDGERLAGASLSVYQASAWAHGTSRDDDNINDSAFRLRIFAGMMPAWTNWNLIFGASAGGHYYDINRPTALGVNDANERGFDMGFFVSWNMKCDLGDGWVVSPFARMDFNYVRVDTIRERGNASALEVNAFGYSTWQTRVGLGIDKQFATSHKNVDSYFGIDLALMNAAQSNTHLNSRFTKYGDSNTSIKAYVEDDFALELAPHLRLVLPHDWRFDLVYRARLTGTNDWSHAISAGVTTQF